VHEDPWDAVYGVTAVQVPSSRKALADISWEFWDHPERAIKLVGITGTNGKTTVAHMLWSIFQRCKAPAGMVGTIDVRIGTECYPATRTTPESLDLAQIFEQMREQDVGLASMEVSSHGLSLDRVHGVPFPVAVFTNLSHEHLDFHHTVEEYRDAKGLLFRNLESTSVAIFNGDDPATPVFRANTSANIWTYSLHDPTVDFYCGDVHADWNGIRVTVRTPVGEQDFSTPLVGKFNAYNLMAAVGAAMALDVPIDDIRGGLNAVKSVPGRFERVMVDVPYTVIVDYAHTPDALENCLSAAHVLPGKRIITVFGCGGDRDRTKRPLMGKIVQDNSDVVIITSDNPRFEDPQRIIDDIIEGIDKTKRHIIEADRREAIEEALSEAKEGDVVVIAGKGHETYQDIRGKKEAFDDRQVVKTCLNRESIA
jgi:UDP-N-acetylmuramoyl-L-alanyl-D-glutamate--2,6-diaminopimelate ligase